MNPNVDNSLQNSKETEKNFTLFISKVLSSTKNVRNVKNEDSTKFGTGGAVKFIFN
jgi:hypothetical protein